MTAVSPVSGPTGASVDDLVLAEVAKAWPWPITLKRAGVIVDIVRRATIYEALKAIDGHNLHFTAHDALRGMLPRCQCIEFTASNHPSGLICDDCGHMKGIHGPDECREAADRVGF